MGVSLFVWLLAKGIDAIVKIPVTLKFLDTRKKRIIAALVSLAMGFFMPLSS